MVQSHQELAKLQIRLRRKLFSKYDGTVVPLKNKEALELIPIMSIDHIRSVEEDKGAMTISVTFTFTWMDERLSWNSSLYNGIRTLTTNRYEFHPNGIWLPTINLADMPGSLKQQDIFLNPEVDVLIQNSGTVKATIKSLVTTPCYFSFGDYPHDYQNCSFTLMTPYYADVFRFAKWGGVDFARNLMENRVTDAEDFQLIGVESNGYFMMMGSELIKEIKPALFSASVLPNKYGLIALILTAMTQFLFAVTMVTILPDNYNGTPIIGKMAFFLFFETIALIGWKLFSLIARTRLKKQIQRDAKILGTPNPESVQVLKTVIYVDLGLIAYLAVQSLVTIHIVYLH
ncbi:hypothetical protein CAEBREN_28700 [Caenorhabditis brenneri]|uniref:Neurotransmitter-gated ion-channel ligand-binding domain-containing protein n=1 Tax=Caenorhabditis brenneri TaxID=135651 RepID=G0PAS5_CAEBE|nr:hypothetical protein CAEBREN_28700 [Caenorhabditis brenneri]